ncbi:hypothetical protein [Friedmanniella luteola]|uniref:hypothetical protein n=1 Tax=Friedmanniella luteola TaxID=546871 RepID=UPI0012FE7828|nr:hypothetical protein [Friedmanniella luteola]
MTVTMVGVVGKLTLTIVDPAAQQPPATSLRFSMLGSCSQLCVTVYAHQPGALVDLDADLSYLSRAPSSGDRALVPAAVYLDRDPLPAVLTPRLAGSDELSAVNRAEGVLIGLGITPDRAPRQLRQQAASAGAQLPEYARQLLEASATKPQ